MNQRLADKELRDVFDLLEQILDSIQKLKKKRNRSLNNIEGTTKWERKILIRFVFFMLFFTAILILLVTFKTNLPIWAIKLLVAIGTASFLIAEILLLLLAILFFYKAWQGMRNLTQEYIQRTREDALTAQREAKRLSRLAWISPTTLEFAKLHFKFSIEEIQTREKTINSFLPVIALILVALITYILGFSIEKFGNPFVPGGGAVILLLLKFQSDLISQSQILDCKRCLSLLEQAQAIAR